MAIDWDLNRIVWNRTNKTNYITRKELLTAVYAQYPTVKKSGIVLCMSDMTVLRAMQEDDVPREAKGHRFPTLAQKKVLEMDTADMYRWQVAEQAEITLMHAWILLTRFKKQWKKLRN